MDQEIEIHQTMPMNFKNLSHIDQTALLKDVDPSILQQQRQLLTEGPSSLSTTFEAFQAQELTQPSSYRKIGFGLIKEGKMGCLLLAGGQGTRLGFKGPKGCFPISPIMHKTLFQLCAEKVLAAGRQVGRPLLLAIMTSSENDVETRNFFEENDYFGLSSDQVYFFTQGELPFLDSDGNLFLETPTRIAKGPDGNGRCLEHFVRSGIWDSWYALGVRYLNLIFIDNPLSDPFDGYLLGYHVQMEADITVKSIERRDEKEKVGMLVRDKKGCRVVEYSEMDPKEMVASDGTGRLKHRCGNSGMFCFSMDFIKDLSFERSFLLLHKAWKSAKFLDPSGNTIEPKEPNAWKFETFIFDLLPYAKKVDALLYPREICFAPLKNADGNDSPETVQSALQAYDRKVLEAISGVAQPEFSFELSPQFYYPTSELLKKWRGRVLEKGGYIENESFY